MTNAIDERFAFFLSATAAVRYGDFVLKSGKRSNVFFNFGEIFLGRELIELGRYYAEFLVHNDLHHCDVIFGPAYKGINIAIATSIALYQEHRISIPFAYNRRVAKTHAEGGVFVGYDLGKASDVVVVDDVITDGGTKYEVIAMLSSFQNLRIRAFVVGVDRQEIDASGRPYIETFKETTGLMVHALTTRDRVLGFRK